MITSHIPISAIGLHNAPWLAEDPTMVTCPLCRGCGHGLGDWSHETCPACNGIGELDITDLAYINEHYGTPEYYWGLDEE